MVCGHPQQGPPSKTDISGCHLNETQNALESRTFPRSVSTQKGHDLACLCIETQAVKDMTATVAGVHIAQFEHHMSPPRYTRCTSSLCRISSGLPSARIRPWRSTIMQLAAANTTSISCSVNR